MGIPAQGITKIKREEIFFACFSHKKIAIAGSVE